MTLNSEGLLPCPFCGSEPEYLSVPGGMWVRCPVCKASSDDSNAIAAWNRRALPPVDGLEVVGLVDALRNAARSIDMECAPEESDLWASANALSQASSVIAGLEARVDELEAAIDSAEIAGGLTENGNLWRFWSQKAQETAGKAEARISSLEEENKRQKAALEKIAQEQIQTNFGPWPTKGSEIARQALEDHNG